MVTLGQLADMCQAQKCYLHSHQLLASVLAISRQRLLIMDSKLRDHCRERLRLRPRIVTLEQISKETKLSRHFLLRLIANQAKDCPAGKLEALYKYFEGKELSL